METKVPGGKLVRLTLRRNGIRRVTLSGDFFIYPEEGILAIEKTLSDLHGDETIEDIESILKSVVEKDSLQLIGLDVPVIARLYKGAANVENPGP